MKRIGIIGGGAAGMMAAITAARQGAKVILFEKNDRVGKKILSTGNGKCNLGNVQLSRQEDHSTDEELVTDVLEAFGTRETIQFFRSLGLWLKEKNGYLYPLCEQAAVVLDALRYELRVLNVEILYEATVTHIRPKNYGFVIHYTGGKREVDRVILAGGGCAAPKTGSDGSCIALAADLGHKIIPQVPALVQLKCKEDYFKAVSGVRCDAVIRAYTEKELIAEEVGELQLTDYGVSGIPIFQLSRQVNYALLAGRKITLRVDVLPNIDREEFKLLQTGRNLLLAERTVEEFLSGTVNKKLVNLFIKLAGLKPTTNCEAVTQEQLSKVYDLMKEWTIEVAAHKGFDNAQVSAGGVSLKEIDVRMESKVVPGLYLAGEVLDVDGRCGGYNLQWAWSSGYLAGVAASKD